MRILSERSFMKRRIFIPLILIALLLIIPLRPSDALPEAVSNVSGSVYEFTSRYKYEFSNGSSTETNGGTAFVIASDSENTYLMTCAHCVNEQKLKGGITLHLGDVYSGSHQPDEKSIEPIFPEKITLFFDRNNWITANTVFISEEYDVALLKLSTADCENSGIEFKPLTLTEPAWLEKVFALGYPDGHRDPLLFDEDTGLTITSGRIISFVNLTPIERKLEAHPINTILVHTAQTHHGNSGGPLVTGNGEVVGLNCCGIKGSEETGFKYTGSIDSITLGKILKENDIPYEHHVNIRIIRDIAIVLLIFFFVLWPKKKL